MYTLIGNICVLLLHAADFSPTHRHHRKRHRGQRTVSCTPTVPHRSDYQTSARCSIQAALSHSERRANTSCCRRYPLLLTSSDRPGLVRGVVFQYSWRYMTEASMRGEVGVNQRHGGRQGESERGRRRRGKWYWVWQRQRKCASCRRRDWGRRYDTMSCQRYRESRPRQEYTTGYSMLYQTKW